MVLTFFFTLSFLTLFPGFFPGWFDSAEFALAAGSLGVSHPSGHPLWVVLAHGFTLLPVGSVAFRTGLLSSVCTAAAITLIARIVRDFSAGPWRALAVVTMLVLLLHPSIGLQATRTEVYALFFGLFSGALFLMLRSLETADARYLLAAGLLTGLAGGLQPLLALTLLPPFAFSVFERKSFSGVAPSLIVGLIGLSVLAFLPLRASVHPILNWDAPETITAFWKALSARDYRVFFHSPLSARGLADFARADLLSLLPLPVLTLGALGVVGVRSIGRKSTTLLAVAFFSSLFPWLAKDFYLRNPDAHAYVIAPLAPLLVLAGMGAVKLFSFLPVRRSIQTFGCCALLTASFLPLMPTGFQSLSAHGSEDAYALSARLDTLPPSSEVRVVSDHWLFPMSYRAFVEGRRPDVAVVAPELLRASWYRNQVLKRHRDLKPNRTFEEAELDPDAGFSHLCADRLANDDPYGIRQNVCAHVFWTSAVHTVANGNRPEAIRVLERVLRPAIRATGCKDAPPPAFPFPLYHDPENRFLMDRLELEAQVALLYLECGQKDAAQALLADAAAVKQRQILAWIQAEQGNGVTALETVLPRRGDRREARGYLWMTRAAIGISTRQMSQARQDLENAREDLGDIQPIRNLETWLRGTKS